MLKAMRHNRVLIGFFTVLVIISMLFFGVGGGSQNNSRYAIKVGEKEISHGEFAEQRRQIEARYRNLFKEKYPEIARSMLKDLNQQILDKFISDSLIEIAASGHGLHAGAAALRKALSEGLFSDGYSDDKYRAFLKYIGETAASFEAKLAADVLRQQFVELAQDSTRASRREARAVVERDEVAYAVEHLEFDPAKFVESIKEPEAGVLEQYFEDNIAQYQLPARVTYDYAVLDPKNFIDLVQVSEDDIELFYADNKGRFTAPEQVKARQIQIFFPKEAKGDALLKVEEHAKEVHAKALAGESFEKLVGLYSEDIISKAAGGDLGWISRGTMPKEFDAAVFKLKEGGVSELIQTGAGFQIVQVEGYNPAHDKELTQVRDEIEKEIRAQEAPAYTRLKAEDVLESWKKNTRPLFEIAAEQKLSVASSGAQRSSGEDPDPSLAGLTDKVIAAAQETKQLVDLKDKFVLLEVTEFKEAEYPALDTVKDKVLAAYKGEHSKKAAREKAESVLAAFKDGTYPDMKSAAEANTLKLERKEEVKRKTPASGIFADQAIKNAVFATYKPLEKPSRVFESSGKFYLIQVASITPPDPKTVEERVIELRNQASDENAQILIASITNKLKADTEVDFDPGLLGDY